MTLLDPKRNILSSQFSSSDHKVLIGSKQSKSILTKNKCPVKFSEETSRSGMLTLGKNNPRLENNVLFSLAVGRSDSDMSEKGKSAMDCLTMETCPDGKCEVAVGSGRSQLTLIDPDPNNLEKSKQSQVALLTSLEKGISPNEQTLTNQQGSSDVSKGIGGQKGSELTLLGTKGKVVALPRPKEKSNPNKENDDPKHT